MTPSPEFDALFWRRHLYWPLAGFVLVTLPFEITDLDLWCSEPFYDRQLRAWPWLENFWASTVVHKGGKYSVWVLGAVPLLVFLGGFRHAPWRAYRRVCTYVMLCLGLSPGLVAALKALTRRHCPWQIETFGGQVPWTRLFDFAPAVAVKGRYGQCFPAAHAATGFGVLCLYFAARALGCQRPARWLWPGAGLGLLFGFGQQVRGAHFASHNLWSWLCCWLTALLLYRAFGGRAGLAPAPAGGARSRS
ncbi:MAG: phosphatase PAP2 family protein [Planctomycetes bacterium]|nr:phosphatase PAP2 family protein [Planctomycetota bacterium]